MLATKDKVHACYAAPLANKKATPDKLGYFFGVKQLSEKVNNAPSEVFRLGLAGMNVSAAYVELQGDRFFSAIVYALVAFIYYFFIYNLN